jgi:hypothetical protein
MRGPLVGTIVVVAILSGVAVGVPEVEPPLADAGLDQQATAGSAVQLDASGSRAPGGNLTGYEWTITTPNGTVVAPQCDTCARTWFVPNQVGRYEATVTVTDDEGRTSSDTLYVDVETGRGSASNDSTNDAGTGGSGPVYRGYYNPQANGGAGAWTETDEDGGQASLESEQDAVNLITANGNDASIRISPMSEQEESGSDSVRETENKLGGKMLKIGTILNG